MNQKINALFCITLIVFSSFINCSINSKTNIYKINDDKNGKTIKDTIKQMDDHKDKYHDNIKQLKRLLRKTKDESQRQALKDAIKQLYKVIDDLERIQDDLHHDSKKEKKEIKEAKKEAKNVGKNVKKINKIVGKNEQIYEKNIEETARKIQLSLIQVKVEPTTSTTGTGKAVVSVGGKTVMGGSKAVSNARARNLASIRASNNAKYQKAYKARVGIKLAGQCIKSLLSVIPPSFCYKKNADAGKIPTMCPVGWHRSAALCYKDCNANEKFIAGVCWEECPEGYGDSGAICHKNCDKGWKDIGLFCDRWHKAHLQSKKIELKPKKSYMPSSITNFDSRVTCETNDIYYKSGALCYRNCSKLAMINCGIGACALDTKACTAGVVTMVVQISMGAAQFVAFVASFGASSGDAAANAAAKAELSQAMSKSSNAITKAWTFF